MKLKSKIFYIFLFILIFVKAGLASEIKQIVDNGKVVSTISMNEINRIMLVNDKVISVKASSVGYELINDDVSGDLYIKSSVRNNNSPLNLFLVTEKKYTYQLLLTPSDVPSMQIILHNPQIISDETLKNLKTSSYKSELIALFKAMFLNEVIPNYNIEIIDIEKEYGDILTSKMVKLYRGEKYHGEKYLITNISEGQVKIDDNKFKAANVRAISFTNNLLKPGDSALMYKVVDRQ